MRQNRATASPQCEHRGAQAVLRPHLGAGSAAAPALAIPVCPRGAEEAAAPELECHLWGWQGAGHSGAAAEHTGLVR